MVWLVLAIVIVGALVVRAINRNTDAHNSSQVDDWGSDFDSESQADEQAVTKRQIQASLDMFDLIYELLSKGARLEDLIANTQLHELAQITRIPFKSFTEAKNLLLSESYLEHTGSLDRVSQLLADGWSNKMIAKNMVIGRPRLKQQFYTANDIAAIRATFLD